MQQARGGMGSHKHGVSGRAPRSPRYKMQTLIEAKKAEAGMRKRKPLPFETVAEAFKDRRK